MMPARHPPAGGPAGSVATRIMTLMRLGATKFSTVAQYPQQPTEPQGDSDSDIRLRSRGAAATLGRRRRPVLVSAKQPATGRLLSLRLPRAVPPAHRRRIRPTGTPSTVARCTRDSESQTLRVRTTPSRSRKTTARGTQESRHTDNKLVARRGFQLQHQAHDPRKQSTSESS
jgi:hypothetical protein